MTFCEFPRKSSAHPLVIIKHFEFGFDLLMHLQFEEVKQERRKNSTEDFNVEKEFKLENRKKYEEKLTLRKLMYKVTKSYKKKINSNTNITIIVKRN